MDWDSKNTGFEDPPQYNQGDGRKRYIPDSDDSTSDGGFTSFDESKDVTPQEEPTPTVFDVAAYILAELGEMTTMKLQKLVYYCQAWSLVWDEKPLFLEPIEAWSNGPVVKELFMFHKGHFTASILPIGNPSVLNDNQKTTINSVLKYYGNKPSKWLIDLSHMEEPWIQARKGLDPMERGRRIISWQSMADYYSSLQS